MKAAAIAAELDKAAAVAQRLGLRPSAWSDDDVVVDHVYGDGELFAVWSVGAMSDEERVDAGGIAAAVSRARAAGRAAKRKAARR